VVEVSSLETIRPMINRDSQFFWDGARKQELRIQSCAACGALRHPPGPSCPACGAFDRTYVVASGLGTVFSFVIHRHPPVPGKELPLVIALIDLDDPPQAGGAPSVRMVGELPGELNLAIGDRVRVDWQVIDDELTLPIWRRA
jgi:uncharacterized OB-fold protein